MDEYRAREDWLARAKVLIANELLPEASIELNGTKVRMACGFPHARDLNVIGQCWSEEASTDATREVFISPILADPVAPQGVLATLTHELIHAALNFGVGHGPDFADACKLIDLVGDPTATRAGEDLINWFKWSVIPRLGAYPHAAMTIPGVTTIGPNGLPPIYRYAPPRIHRRMRPQTNRQLLYACPVCGQKIRAAKRDLRVICADDQILYEPQFIMEVEPA